MIKIFNKIIEKESNEIKSGKKYTFYLLYCEFCKKYKRILSSAPVAPGGTFTCPYCKENEQCGPGLENSYGRVKIKTFKLTLPKEVDIEKD